MVSGYRSCSISIRIEVPRVDGLFGTAYTAVHMAAGPSGKQGSCISATGR